MATLVIIGIIAVPLGLICMVWASRSGSSGPSKNRLPPDADTTDGSAPVHDSSDSGGGGDSGGSGD